MLCKRCGGEFDRADLRPPSLALRLLAAPYFLPLLLKSGALRGEINALGLKSIVSGTITTCLMGAIVGTLN